MGLQGPDWAQDGRRALGLSCVEHVALFPLGPHIVQLSLKANWGILEFGDPDSNLDLLT